MLRDDGVVDDTASSIEKDGECGRVWRERGQRGRGEPFKKRKRCLATEAKLHSPCAMRMISTSKTGGMLTCSEPCALHRRDLPSPEHVYGCRLEMERKKSSVLTTR